MKARLKMEAVVERVPQAEQQLLLQPPGKALSGLEMTQTTTVKHLHSFDKDSSTPTTLATSRTVSIWRRLSFGRVLLN